MSKSLDAFAFAAALSFGAGCDKDATETEPENCVAGTVIDESFFGPYFFSLNTPGGRKAVQVNSDEKAGSGAIKLLLEPGDTVEVCLTKGAVHDQVFSVDASKVHLKEPVKAEK